MRTEIITTFRKLEAIDDIYKEKSGGVVWKDKNWRDYNIEYRAILLQKVAKHISGCITEKGWLRFF